MKRRSRPLLYFEIAILSLLCIPSVIVFLFPGWLPELDRKIPGIVFVIIVISCDVIIHALVAVKRREWPLHYIEIALRILVCAPLGALVTFFLTFGYGIPTPGIYAGNKLVPNMAPEEWLDPLLSRLFVAGLVNVICFYVIILAVVALVGLFRRDKQPAGARERT